MTTPLQASIQFAFQTFDEPGRALAEQEFGAVLYWESIRGILRPSPIVNSPSSESVHLYSAEENERVLRDEPSYLGDYHAHPVGRTWLSQFPSPTDISSVSALADFWPNEAGVRIEKAPRFQLVQSLLFGDVLCVESMPGRSRFESPRKQERGLTKIERRYESVFRAFCENFGNIPPTVSPAEFHDIADKILPALNKALGGRATMRLIKMPSPKGMWQSSARVVTTT